MDMPTGEVLAYVGNLRAAGQDNAGSMDLVRAQRSTGSLLKPFLHADMLGCGELLPDMLVADVPTQYEGFAPHNYEEAYAGALPASQALARSLNVPAVRALRRHGVDRTLRTLRGMGLSHISRSADHYGLSLIIGGAESSLWELTGAYASMARIVHQHGRGGAAYHAGSVHPPLLFGKAPTPHAGPDPTLPPLSAAAIHFTLKALRDVKRPGSEAGWEVFRGQPRIAWKTGTSVGHRDAWAIGTSGRYTIGVWTGNADGEGRPGLTGTLAAAPILFDLFGRLPDSPLPEPPYDELVRAAICRASGHLAGQDCPLVDTVFVQEQGVRTPICPYHRTILVDHTGRWRVRPGQGGLQTSWMVFPPAMEHYYALREPGYRPLPPYADPGPEDLEIMEVLYPEPGARLFIPTELDGTQGQVVVQVTHREGRTTLDWDLDGSYAGRTTGDHRMALSPAEGAHRLTLTDQHGNTLERRFTVVASARAQHTE
jgi:penicillin-binding protein 1C